MQTIAGIATARGFAMGPVFVYRGGGEIQISEYVIEVGREESELLRLRHALTLVKRDIESLIAVLRQRTSNDDVKVFECHLMMLEDPLWTGEIERLIRETRVNAEAAVKKATAAFRAQFAQMNDAYFRERVRDLDDVERRVLKALIGFAVDPHLELKAPAIVVADDLTPSETVQLPREYILGFATNGGSATSHAALLARAMGIPAVAGLGNVTELVKPGDTVLLDGTNGALTLNADETEIAEFRQLIERKHELVTSVNDGAPAGTLKDGSEILICANVHPGVPVGGLREYGARGVGLYRSEYLWLNRDCEPTEEDQFVAYRDAARFCATMAEGAVLTIRVLDIGGDKMMRGISSKESNPFLGNRSIRYLLHNREVFRTQLRAILRASAFGKIAILYPMISCVEELREAAQLLAKVKAELDAGEIAYDRALKVGAMIEVPSAAINARSIAKYVDFFSIGTNDLIQYTMAADRGNKEVAHLYQPTNPAVIELMRWVIGAAKKARIPVAVCGESAADPVVGVLWVAMGVDALSMSASYIPVMAKLLRNFTRAELDDYIKMMEAVPDDSTAQAVYDACYAWMRQKLPNLDEILI